MRLPLALLLVIALARPAHAEVQFFFLHEGPTPVPIPGGTSAFYIDTLNIDPGPRVSEQHVLANGETADFPTFTSVPFTADTTLLPIASIALHLAANQKMRSCATVAADVFTVDAGGNLAPNGNVAKSEVTIDQGNPNELGGVRVELALTNPALLAGQGFAVSSSLTNDCAIKRRTFLEHSGSVRFQCCFTTAAQCGAKKIAAVNANAYCRLVAAAKETKRGTPPDLTVAALCDLRATSNFVKYESRSRGKCLTTGDGPDFVLLSSALVEELRADLDPLGPRPKNKCQAGKIRTAGRRLQCLLKLQAKAVQKVQLLDPDPVKVAKCATKFSADFAKLEAQGGCDTTGDDAAVAAKVDAFVTTVASRLACPCP